MDALPPGTLNLDAGWLLTKDIAGGMVGLEWRPNANVGLYTDAWAAYRFTKRVLDYGVEGGLRVRF